MDTAAKTTPSPNSYQPLYIIRERLMCGGPSGTSKTYSFLKIIEHLPDESHFAIEVDDGFIRLLALEFPHIQAAVMAWVGNDWIVQYGDAKTAKLWVYHCDGFLQVREAQRAMESLVAQRVLTGKSWVCVDGLDLIYNNMRYEFINRGLPSKIARRTQGAAATLDPWEAAIQIRNTGTPMLEQGDWDVIHSFLEDFLTYAAFRIPCHLYIATGLGIIQDNEQDEIKKFYESLGVPLKFEGYKRAPRIFDTLLAFSHDPTGYYVSIWKDRGGAGRAWSKSGRHSAMSKYTNQDFYADIGRKLFGWS